MGNKEHNPNAYYYRFNQPGEAQKNGAVQMDEHKVFMERVKEVGVNMHWGTFSMKIPGRVGYQCSNYWRQMMKDQWVKDPNYWIRADGSFCFKRAKKGSVPDAIRKYSFVVLKDPSKTFEEPGYHPKRPSDSKLTKYLQDNVRDIVNKKKGGKSKKKRAPPKREVAMVMMMGISQRKRESDQQRVQMAKNQKIRISQRIHCRHIFCLWQMFAKSIRLRIKA